MTEQDFKRKLTAVFSADVAGYSRLMGEDEAATVKTLEAYKQVMFTLVRQHRGRVVDSPGDNVLAEFGSVVDAVQCAVAVQKELQSRNAAFPESRRMEFRIGINLGDVIEEEDRIYGDGVNIAARLEALADPGGICVTKTAFDHIESKLPLGYEYLGEQEVKNIAKPVGAYRVMLDPRVTVAGEEGKRPSAPLWRRKGVLVGVAGVIAVAVGFGIWKSYFWPSLPAIEPASVEKMAHTLPDKPSIAVIPFENVSDETGHDSLAYGLSSNITTTLAKSARLFVIAIESAAKYRGKSPEVRQASEDLGVQYVLRGEVLAAEKRLRISTQLYDALTGKCKWAEKYDIAFGEFFDTLDRITLAVAKAISIEITHGEQLKKSKGTKNLDAFLLTQQAWDLYLQLTKEKNFEARRLYEEALKLDPDYSDALSGLAWTYGAAARYKWDADPAESRRKADELTEKAIELDDTNSWALMGLAYIRRRDGDFDESLSYYRKAIEADPNDDHAHYNMGATLYFLGQVQGSGTHIGEGGAAVSLLPVLALAQLGESLLFG